MTAALHPSPVSAAEKGRLVSPRLAALAAGIPRGDARRIAREVAAGKRSTWRGASVRVHTFTEGRRPHHCFVADTLPAAVRAELASDRLRFRVAAEQVPPGAELGPADFMLLHEAAQAGIAPDLFGNLVNSLAAGGPLVLATRARFELVTDYLFGFGLRSTKLPEIGPDYAAYLDEARRQVGIGDDDFTAMLREVGGVERPMALTGPGFLRALLALDGDRTLRLLPSPRGYMSRAFAGQIHQAAYRLNLAYAEHLDVLIQLGGGCYRVNQLDERGARRVLSHYFSRGFRGPEPAPRVSGAPGFISQAQVNLIWKLWHDYNASDADVSEAALAAWLYDRLAIEGGLHALTAAGASRVLDYMLAPLIALRLKAVEVWEAGVASAPGSP